MIPRSCRNLRGFARNSAGLRSFTTQSTHLMQKTTKPGAAQPSAQPVESTRPQPAATFNQTPKASRLERPSSPDELDYSFIGMSGGEIFHEMMLRHDVKKVFGYPGGAILPVFDAIYQSEYFDFVLPRHEQGAGHMAEGYARVSGKPGVVLVTSGPGATNVITPLQDALSDGTPLVVFCGQVATSAIGSDGFQEADIVGISRSCTKWNVMVKDIAEIPRRINEAFKIATSGRPGPVLVDLPKDITASILKTPVPFRYTHPDLAETNLPVTRTTPQAPSHGATGANIERAAELIANAKSPLIYAGQGILSSEEGPDLLRILSRKGNIPVTTTLMGLGAFDEKDPRALEMLGMHGSAVANLAMQNADVVIALGARFDDRVTGRVDRFAPAARAAALQRRGGIIHFEIMPKNVNKVINADVPILGNVGTNLARLIKALPEEPPARTAWFEKLDEWKTKYPFAYTKSTEGEFLKPQEVVEALDTWCENYGKENVVIATGVGQHQMWAAQFYKFRHPRSIVTSGGLGTMGFGLPAAIGAKVGEPDKVVVDIDGDASFSMTGMELATAAQYNIGVKILVLNNEFQGMVQQWQDLFYDQRYSETKMINPDFVALAKSMGVHGISATTREELPAKMKEFLEYDNNKPVLFEVRVAAAEHVYPMVPAGKALHEAMLHPSLDPIDN